MRTPSTTSGTLQTILQNRRGNALITVGVAMVMLFGFALLAIDGAILLTTKTQLQNAADSAALAAASGMINGGEDEATRRAIHFASLNVAVEETQSAVNITAEDVEFIGNDRVRVTTHRTNAHGDPLRSYFRRVVDFASDNTTDVSATAVAQFGDVCGIQCVKPWSIPDRWDDVNADGVWQQGEYYDPNDTGYISPDDVGTMLTLKQGDPHDTMAPGQFFPIALPPIGQEPGPITGASAYREWIAGCAPFVVSVGDSLLLEPGNMVGPTNQGVELLIEQDKDAYWDPNTETVVSDLGTSPRIILVPFFDPRIPPQSGRKSVVVTKIGAFFIEERRGGGNNSTIEGRFIKVASPGKFCVNQLNNGLVVGIRLVE